MREVPADSGIALRRAGPGDAARLLEWRNDADVIRFSMTGRPVDAADHAAWFASALARPGVRLWIAEEGGTPVGQVRIDVKDGTGTVSIAVAPSHRGRGIGTSMLGAMVAEVEAGSGVRTLRAVVHRDNIASRRAFERQGFTDTGRRRKGFLVFELDVGAKR